MLLREIYEQNNKTAVFAFGRMNPPTVGHLKLAETVANLPGDSYLFLTHTQKNKTDSLDFETKRKFAQSFFPGITVGDPEVRTIMEALKKLESKGYQNIIFVGGGDRIDEFASLLHKYNGQEYNFKNISVVSSGERDPDAAGVEGMSASKLREAARTGNYEAFCEGVPNPRAARDLYSAVRKGMGIAEEPPQQRPQQPQPQQQAPQITPVILNKLEKYLDALFARLGIDVEFTRHFLDRVNDERNIKQITV